MKKIIASILVLATCVSMVACSGDSKESSKKEAFEVSKSAYSNVKIAYEITEQISSDIYEAWHLGIFEDERILEGGMKGGIHYMASKLSLNRIELREGLRYVMEQAGKPSDRDDIDIPTFFSKWTDAPLFSVCIYSVIAAYTINGKVEEAQNALNAAKAQMKELSENYSDYEHYPNLKGYYTTTSSFFDFCQNPTGSFDQATETINDYKNKARDYISDLDFIFEE